MAKGDALISLLSHKYKSHERREEEDHPLLYPWKAHNTAGKVSSDGERIEGD
jgi:hypothetical protein